MDEPKKPAEPERPSPEELRTLDMFSRAIDKLDMDGLKELVEKDKKNVNVKEWNRYFSSRPQGYTTPLKMAACYDDYDKVKEEKRQETDKKCLEMVKYLLKHGADITSEQSGNRDILTRVRNREIAETILEAIPDKEKKKFLSESGALSGAVKNKALFKRYLELGADPAANLSWVTQSTTIKDPPPRQGIFH